MQHRQDTETAAVLLERAQEDARAIRLLLTDAEAMSNIICYHCQQCAEKQLKAALLAHGEKCEKTHNIDLLLRAAAALPVSHPPLTDDLVIAAGKLTMMEAASRYSGLGASDRPIYSEAVAMVNKIAHWMEESGLTSVRIDSRYVRLSASTVKAPEIHQEGEMVQEPILPEKPEDIEDEYSL